MYNVDTPATLAVLDATIESMVSVEDHQNDLLADVAAYAAQAVKARISLFGDDADGNPIVSPSSRKIGRYAEGYARERQQMGLQTDYVDLTVTGDLMNDFGAHPDGDGWAAGFSSPEMQQRAAKLDEHFGADLYGISDAEADEAADYYNHNLGRLLDNLLPR